MTGSVEVHHHRRQAPYEADGVLGNVVRAEWLANLLLLLLQRRNGALQQRYPQRIVSLLPKPTAASVVVVVFSYLNLIHKSPTSAAAAATEGEEKKYNQRHPSFLSARWPESGVSAAVASIALS